MILTGDQEPPNPNDSTATGVGVVVFDSEAIAATYSFDIEGLDFGPITTGQPRTDPNDVTNAHFHANVRGVSGGVVFGQITPNHDADDVAFVLNADGSWSVSGRWETTDPSPINGFNAVLGDAFANVLGSATVGSEIPLYFNVHTLEHGPGEIRGQLVAIASDVDNVETGTTGNDELGGGRRNDAVIGLAGDDTLGGGNGNDVLDGGSGNDEINGSNGNDSMNGSAGNDELNGGNGNDSMNGGTSDDVMDGGNGGDLFILNDDFGDDVITDFEGNDRIQFDDELFATPAAVLLAAQQVGDDTVITAGTNSVTLLGVELSSLQANDFTIVA